MSDDLHVTSAGPWDPWRPVENADPLESGVLFTLSHGGFLEGCPTYDLVVHEDGRVGYLGRQHVRVIGGRTWRMSGKRLHRVKETLAALPSGRYDYAPYTHAGRDDARCAFSRELVYRTDGETRILRHTIDGAHAAPPCLRRLELELVKHTGALRRTGSDPLGDSPVERPL